MFSQSCSSGGNKTFCCQRFKMELGREKLELGILFHRWKQCLDMKKEAVCLQLTLFRGLLQNDVVLITFYSSRNFNSRVQTIDLKILHFHSFSTSLK